MFNVNREILSFHDIPSISRSAARTVLLLRHSYRESLQNGNLDPGLTPEGEAFAESCGASLKGMENLCFGASFRKRTVQTVQAIIRGGGLKEAPIADCPPIYETALFSSPEELTLAIDKGTLPRLLNEYYTSGKAPGMVDLEEFVTRLTVFLTDTAFEEKNVILATHDIVLVALLSYFKVYPFHQEDWCGYVQGAFLSQSPQGDWTMSYAVPDRENRKLHQLFV